MEQLPILKLVELFIMRIADLEKVLETNKVEATATLFNPKWLVR